MHIVESYALVSGLPISECFIKEEPIDLPNSKYITFHPYCEKAMSRRYKHWNMVVEKLQANENFDYEIVQVGGKYDTKYPVNTSYLGETSFNSLAYLIHNADLHLGYDSFPLHLASHFQRKIVAVYNQPAQISGPYFSKEEDIVILEPQNYPELNRFIEGNFMKAKGRISHSFQDEFDLINTIDPDLVYMGVTKLLNIER